MSESEKLLTEEISELIDSKKEGSFWDFKREWHFDSQELKKNKKVDLLHDIICMANNLEDRDSYIIIGVDEENDYCLKDVTNDPNRKNTQKIINFLADAKFADVRPFVHVETIFIDNIALDVIVIKNTISTPYYLNEGYQGKLYPKNIYTRVGNTNTPKSKTADLSNIEYLWKKRFGIDKSIQKRLELYMQDYMNWTECAYPRFEDKHYYKKYPEFTFQFLDEDAGTERLYCICSNYILRKTSSWHPVVFNYHQTAINYCKAITMESLTIAAPSFDISFEGGLYLYYIKGSTEHSLTLFRLHHSTLDEAAKNDFWSCVLVFESEAERRSFDTYLTRSKDFDIKKGISRLHDVTPTTPRSDEEFEVLTKMYNQAKHLKNLLSEFRSLGSSLESLIYG